MNDALPFLPAACSAAPRKYQAFGLPGACVVYCVASWTAFAPRPNSSAFPMRAAIGIDSSFNDESTGFAVAAAGAPEPDGVAAGVAAAVAAAVADAAPDAAEPEGAPDSTSAEALAVGGINDAPSVDRGALEGSSATRASDGLAEGAPCPVGRGDVAAPCAPAASGRFKYRIVTPAIAKPRTTPTAARRTRPANVGRLLFGATGTAGAL